jgi:hypothetical protein
MSAFYSERARCQHQCWEIFSNADANPNWPIRFSKLQIKREKRGNFQPTGASRVKISRMARELHALNRPCTMKI